ncbi:hypothetical protein LSCM1_02824 [Leishmania martiniquensis]|uniref:Flagellar attachment zone protein 1 conserved domain-containing protein n=1 Tax=Leishmania martiniquensis TaxID=1580590 RepID=A0A836GTD8_9TRYP|nr:hypothetical protein LSCM1_02824 [Leishmania martiniquensis]
MASVTVTAHHPYNGENPCQVTDSARGDVSTPHMPIPTLSKAVKPSQQSLRSPTPIEKASVPWPAAAASSIASVQRMLIEYEALCRRDLMIDFYLTYPNRLAVGVVPPPPPRQSELTASTASRLLMSKPPPGINPSRSTSKRRTLRASKKAKMAGRRRTASAGEWRRFRLVFPGALWPFVLRYHRQLLVHALRHDADAALLSGETVEVFSLYAAEEEIEIIMAVRESPASRSNISAALSRSPFAEAWEVYNAVAVFLSRRVPQTPPPPPSVLSPPLSYESAACASAATTPAAVGKAATTVQPVIVSPLPPLPAPHKSKMGTTSFTKASLSTVEPTAAALPMCRPLNMRVPLLFPAENTDELQRLVDTAPSPLRLALRRDAMYAVSDAEVQVYSWAVHPAGLYVELLLRCTDGSDAYFAFNAETAIDRCPFMETWDVIRAYTTGMASVNVTVPLVVKHGASRAPIRAPSLQSMETSVLTMTSSVGQTKTATASQPQTFACSSSPHPVCEQSAWLLPAGASLSASEHAKSEQNCGNPSDTVYGLIAGNGAHPSVKLPRVSPSAVAVSASTVTTTTPRELAAVKSKWRAMNMATTQMPAKFSTAVAAGQMKASASMSLLMQSDSVRSSLSSASSALKARSIAHPSASAVSTSTLQHLPRARSANERTALMIDKLEREVQESTESAKYFAQQLASRSMTTKSTSPRPLAHASQSMETKSDTRTTNRALLSPLLCRPARPISSHSSDHTANVVQERLSSPVLLDAQRQYERRLRSGIVRRALARLSSASSAATEGSWLGDLNSISSAERVRGSTIVHMEREAYGSGSLVSDNGAERRSSCMEVTEMRTTSSLHLALVPLLVPHDSQEQAAAVAQEPLASHRSSDAVDQRSKSLRVYKIMRAISDREEGTVVSESPEPIVPSAHATALKQTLELPSLMKSIAPLQHEPSARHSTAKPQRGSRETTECERIAGGDRTAKDQREAPSPSLNSGVETKSAVQKAHLSRTKGMCASSKTGKKRTALSVQSPLLAKHAVETDVQISFGLLMAAVEKAIVGRDPKLYTESVAASDEPLQPYSREPMSGVSPNSATTSSAFSPGIVESTTQRRALLTGSILNASAKSTDISPLECFSPTSASAPSALAECAQTLQVQLPRSPGERLVADHVDDVTEAAVAGVPSLLRSAKAKMRATSSAEEPSPEADLSVSKPTLSCELDSPESQQVLERCRLLHGRQLPKFATAAATVRVRVRRFFSVSGLTQEKLAGILEEARSLFLSEACAALDASPNLVDEVQLSGNLTVDVTLRVLDSDLGEEWRSVLMAYDYPQLSELLARSAATQSPQAPDPIEVDAASQEASCENLFCSIASISAPDGGDTTSLAVYIKGSLWPGVIDAQADVLREALITDTNVSLSASELSVQRVSVASFGQGALFTFLLRNCGASPGRAAQDALQQCPFAAVWELYRRLHGVSRHSMSHQVTDTTCALQLGGQAWEQVVKEHGGLLAETFAWEMLQCLRGSDSASVTGSVSVTDVAAKPGGLTIAYEITKTADGTDVDRGRVADAVKEYPFPELWKVYDTFMLARGPFKYTKNAQWIASRRLRNLSTAYEVAKELTEPRLSHLDSGLLISSRPLETDVAAVTPPEEIEKDVQWTFEGTPEMTEAKEYVLKYLPTPTAVSELLESLVPLETAAVTTTRSSHADVAEVPLGAVVPDMRAASREGESARAKRRAATPPPALSFLENSPQQQSQSLEGEEEAQQQRWRRGHRHRRSTRAKHKRRSRQRASRYAAAVSSMEAEPEEEEEGTETTTSSESDRLVEHAAAPRAAPLRSSPVVRATVRVLASPVAAQASLGIPTPISQSSLITVLSSAEPVEPRASPAVQVPAPLSPRPKSVVTPPVFSLSHPASITAADEAAFLPRLYLEARGVKPRALQAEQCHLMRSRLPLRKVFPEAPITLLDMCMTHSSLEGVADSQLAACILPTVFRPQYSAYHHVGASAAPHELLHKCQIEKATTQLFSVPSPYCSVPASFYHSRSSPLLTPASSLSRCGSAASMLSAVASTSAPPLQGTSMSPSRSSSFVVVSIEPNSLLERLRDDVHMVEEAIRTRYPRLQRDLMIATAAATLPSS